MKQRAPHRNPMDHDRHVSLRRWSSRRCKIYCFVVMTILTGLPASARQDVEKSHRH